MTITTEDPPVAELQLHAGESLTRPGWCAMCGEAPCGMAGGTPQFTSEQLCYQVVRPTPLSEWARRTANRLLGDLGLSMWSADWTPGTSDMLRALADELTGWADHADRAARRREEDGR